MMFGRKKKAMAEYASGLAKIINVLFVPLRQLHGGDLPPEVTADKFILGYIAGVVIRGAHAAGFTGPTDGDDITVQVYEMFFPGQGRELHRLTEDWWKNEMEDMEDTQNMTPAEARQIIKQSKDKVHLTAFYLGKDESKRESGRSLSEHLERKYMQGSTSEYRTLMDRLLSDKRIRPSEPTKPEDEVVTVSIYIAEHAVKRSGKNIESLSAGETFVAMLIALVSANVLSAAANVSFELTGGVACTGLCLQIHPHKKGEEIGTLVREVIDDHNKMVTDPDSKIVEAIGTQTEKFFSTANEEYLSKQSELFQMLSKKLAEGS